MSHCIKYIDVVRSGIKNPELRHNSGFFAALHCFGNPIPQSMVLPPLNILGLIYS